MMTMEQLQAKMLRWSVAMPKAAKKALRTAAEIVRRESQLAHLSGPKMPRGIGHDTMATLQPQTGRLRRSIAIDVRVSPGQVSARVGTNVEYARQHEFGQKDIRGVKMPERPFLRPSLAKEHLRIFKLLEEAAISSYA